MINIINIYIYFICHYWSHKYFYILSASCQSYAWYATRLLYQFLWLELWYTRAFVGQKQRYGWVLEAALALLSKCWACGIWLIYHEIPKNWFLSDSKRIAFIQSIFFLEIFQRELVTGAFQRGIYSRKNGNASRKILHNIHAIACQSLKKGQMKKYSLNVSESKGEEQNGSNFLIQDSKITEIRVWLHSVSRGNMISYRWTSFSIKRCPCIDNIIDSPEYHYDLWLNEFSRNFDVKNVIALC